ncbi:HNH endonuclease [Mycolicibacterium sp.]|uniref:HNH endonuclease n=1 Tax=Mycolicibacterium sp. TaxID=2320850 RepID=UPI0037C9E895
MTQEWRPIPGYEADYEISRDGIVHRITGGCRRAIAWEFVSDSKSQTTTRHLRATVRLRKAGRRSRFGVGSLVLSAFVGPRPEGLVCCHNDGNAANNSLTNLRWDTQQKNVWDSIALGRHNNTANTCEEGHPLVYLDHRGVRTCLVGVHSIAAPS